MDIAFFLAGVAATIAVVYAGQLVTWITDSNSVPRDDFDRVRYDAEAARQLLRDVMRNPAILERIPLGMQTRIKHEMQKGEKNASG